MNKLLTLAMIAGIGIAMLANPANALRDLSLEQQGELPRDLYLDLVDPEHYNIDQLVVKFSEDTRVRLRNGSLVSLEGWNLDRVDAYLAKYPKIAVERLFHSTEEGKLDDYVARGERLSGIDMADLNNYYMFRINGINMDPVGMLEELLDIGLVQTCYYEPIAEPATCGSDPAPTTPVWLSSQNYREPAPLGIDIDYAWAHDPVYGNGVSSYWWLDLEWGWCETHEDYPSNFTIRNPPDSGVADDYNHGTAVVGVVSSCDDGKGMVGLTPECKPNARVVSNHPNTADALTTIGVSDLITGETYLIEMHAQGPDPGTTCPCNCSQFRYIAMEYWTANYDAILVNSGNGRICVEAAGNGSMDLDWAGYGGAFDLGVRDSQAIIVGASTSDSTHDPSCFTNHGSRISAYGYGENVYTTGYGGLFNQAGCDQDYTSTFGGTSSASPIVTGAAISLNLIHWNQEGSYPSPTLLRSRLQTHGTPQSSDLSREISVLPNMKGILAPDLEPYQPGGWDAEIVPSDVTGTTVLPANLAPAPESTYFDFAWVNWSRYSEAYAHARLYRDDVYIVGGTNSNLNPYTFASIGDWDGLIRGGLHYMKLVCDPLDAVDESVENNNQVISPYRWDEMPLVYDTPATYTRGPDRSPEGYSYNAVDGFGLNISGWFEFAGVMSASAAGDYDLRLYNEAPTTNNGWDTYIHASGYSSLTDFVGLNQNNGGGDARYVSVMNWNDTSESYTIEGDGSTTHTLTDEPTLIGSYTIGAGEILEAWETNAVIGDDIFLHFDVTSGNGDLAVSLFDPTTQYLRRSNATWSLNAAGAGEDETGVFTVVADGYHGIVAYKNFDSELNETISFDLYMGKAIGDLVHEPYTGYDAPLVVRQGGSVGTTSASLVEGATMADAGYMNVGAGIFAGGSNWGMYLDGPLVYESGNFIPFNPGQQSFLSSRSIGTVKGGRHEVGGRVDINNEVPEQPTQGELNNWTHVQYAWAPYALPDDTRLTRSAPPNYLNSNNPNWFLNSGFNQDGYSFTSNLWTAVAAVSQNLTRQLNVHGYDYASTNRDNALLDPVSSSFTAPGEAAFIVANGNVLGSVPFDVGVTDNLPYPTDPSSGNYFVQAANSSQDIYVGTAVSSSLGTDRIIEVFDIYLTAGETHPVVLTVPPGTDLGVAIFDAGIDYADHADANLYLDTPGYGVDEAGSVTATATGWHGVVVFRKNFITNAPAPFNLVIGSREPARIDDLTVSIVDHDETDGLYHFTLQFSDVTQDVDGNPLTVDQYRFYWSTDAYAPFPGIAWHHWANNTASELINFSAGTSSHNWLVTAVDEDGLVVASSHPLPAGITDAQIQAQTSTALTRFSGADTHEIPEEAPER